MANCRTTSDVAVMGVGKMGKNKKVYVSVIDPIPMCINFRANTYNSVTSTGGSPTVTYHKYNRPKDVLNCPEPLCVTTGTLYTNFLKDSGTPTETVIEYLIDDSTIDYIDGVINYYVELTGQGVYTFVTKISDQTSGGAVVSFTDTITGLPGDVYPKIVTVQRALDESLLQLPLTQNGMKITIGITPDDTGSDNEVGISSVSMVMDKSDYELNSTVTLTCIDELDFPTDVDLTDMSCLGQSLDPDSLSLEMTITAQQVTGNVFNLNPLLHKTDGIEAFDVESRTRTISEVTINGTAYKGVHLRNYANEECGYLSAYLPACDVTESILNYNSMKNEIVPDEKAFKVLTDEASGRTYAIFNAMHDGLDVTVTYPVTKTGIVYEANTDFVEGRRIRFHAPIEFKNGYKGYILSENAYVTSFPLGWSSTEDTPLEFTISFVKENNRFYKLVLFDETIG